MFTQNITKIDRLLFVGRYFLTLEKTKPGTNPGTKKSQDLTLQLKSKSGTKLSFSITKLRTLANKMAEIPVNLVPDVF